MGMLWTQTAKDGCRNVDPWTIYVLIMSHYIFDGGV